MIVNPRTAALLASGLLVLTGCGGGASKDAAAGAAVTTTGDAQAQVATVDMTDSLTFEPSTVNARVGAVTLEAKNIGRVPHNLVFGADGLGKTGTVSGGDSEPLALTFSQAGTFTFVCTFHSGMNGKVVVS